MKKISLNEYTRKLNEHMRTYIFYNGLNAELGMNFSYSQMVAEEFRGERVQIARTYHTQLTKKNINEAVRMFESQTAKASFYPTVVFRCMQNPEFDPIEVKLDGSDETVFKPTDFNYPSDLLLPSVFGERVVGSDTFMDFGGELNEEIKAAYAQISNRKPTDMDYAEVSGRSRQYVIIKKLLDNVSGEILAAKKKSVIGGIVGGLGAQMSGMLRGKDK